MSRQGDMGIGGPHRLRDMGRGLADQFQVTQGGIVGQAIVQEPVLVQAVGVGHDLLGKSDHVIQIKEPFAWTFSGLRHGSLPARCVAAVRGVGTSL